MTRVPADAIQVRVAAGPIPLCQPKPPVPVTRPTDELVDALAKVAALQSSLSTANGRVHELELLAERQNRRITEVMKLADDAERSYSEMRAKWQLERRESEQAKIQKRRGE
jgi:hypothetical protein